MTARFLTVSLLVPVVAVLVLALLAFFAAPRSAGAQSSGTLVSNQGQREDIGTNLGQNDLAQGFTTGPTPTITLSRALCLQAMRLGAQATYQRSRYTPTTAGSRDRKSPSSIRPQDLREAERTTTLTPAYTSGQTLVTWW